MHESREFSQTSNKNSFSAQICDKLKKTNVILGTDDPLIKRFNEPERPLTSNVQFSKKLKLKSPVNHILLSPVRA